MPVETRDDLSLAYTPGVARPCEVIAADPARAYDLTIKGNSMHTNNSAPDAFGMIRVDAQNPAIRSACSLFVHNNDLRILNDAGTNSQILVTNNVLGVIQITNNNMVTNTDARFRGKVVIVDIFGTWCPTCHDAAPTLVDLYRRYHDSGLEIVGLAYEVTGDSAVDGELLRRYREKYGIEFPLLLAGVNDGDSPSATQPQLSGPIAFPTTVFIDRTGAVRRVHAGFYGPALAAAHDALRREFAELVEELLGER